MKDKTCGPQSEQGSAFFDLKSYLSVTCILLCVSVCVFNHVYISGIVRGVCNELFMCA